MTNKLQEFTQLQLKDALTKQAAKDLHDLTKGSTAHQTIMNMINSQIKNYNAKHQPKGWRGAANTLS